MVLTDKILRCPNRKAKRSLGGFSKVVSFRMTHLDRTFCSAWSPGCSRCDSDRWRNRKSWRSDPSPRTGRRHIRSHLQQETESDGGGQKEKGSKLQETKYSSTFFFSPKVGTLNPISVGRSPAEAMQSQGLHREVREHGSAAAFWMGYCAVVTHHGTSQHKQNGSFSFRDGRRWHLAEGTDKEATDKACVTFSVLLTLTNAVGLQRAELESQLALAGVAGLHRNTFTVATYGGGEGALVDACEKPQRVNAREV